MNDLNAITYKNLKELVDSIKLFENELSELDRYCICLWDNDRIVSLENSVVEYLDEILGDESASYFIYECNFGRLRNNDGKPYSIVSNDKTYYISDFDSWYSYLLENQK